MNEKMRSCVIGLIMGICGNPLPESSGSQEVETTDAYDLDHTTRTLTVKQEENLNFDFSWDTMRMDVGVKE